jgi:DNA polymerase
MLDALRTEASSCTRCALSQSRTQVVFGNGHPNADLMFVGEAPGFHEDQQGIPFVGQAGKLLDKLLAGVGLTRADVYVVNTLKCRPPGNRDPLPEEKHQCEPWLFKQIELIKPKVIATLGNHATKQLTGKETGITRVHGQPQQAVEQLPGLADEREPLLVLVEAGRLADEHEIRLGVADAEHDLRPRLREAAARAAGGFSRVEL